MAGRGAYRYKVGRPYVRGKGAYRIPGFNAPKFGGALGSMGGMAIGNMIAPGIGGEVGSTLGGKIGSFLGNKFRELTGFGDYQIKANSLLYPDAALPSFGPDTIRVKKREYITDVVIGAGGDFVNNSFPINPGLSETFPWLSAIANNYEQYRWNGLIFEYVSTSATAFSSTGDIRLGTVCLASDYNALDPAYVNMPQMLSTMFSNSNKPSECIQHAVECAPSDVASKLYYVRSGDNPFGSDLRLYDMLSFQVGTEGIPGNQLDRIGQLWVNYDITFCKSVQNNQIGFDLNTDYWRITTFSAANYFGAANEDRTLMLGSNLGTTLTNDEIIFPPTLSSGYYLINIVWLGASTAVTNPTVAAESIDGAATMTAMAGWVNGSDTWTHTQGGSTAGATSTRLIYTAIWRINMRDAALSFSAGTLPGTPDSATVYITQVNGEIFLNPNF